MVTFCHRLKLKAIDGKMGIKKFNTTEVTGGFYKSNFHEDTKCPIGHLVSS